MSSVQPIRTRGPHRLRVPSGEGAGRRAWALLLFGAVLAAALTLVSIARSEAPPSDPQPSATRTFTLYGSLSGWGTSATTITSPGPTLTVALGDQVTINLNSVSLPHDFLLDYNDNQFADVGEPHSDQFNPTTPRSLSFTADRQGTFRYWCTLHFNAMWGSFIVGSGSPPAATLSTPDGNQVWTGGTAHGIWWNMSDAEDANTDLVVYLNYSSSAGSGTIAGPIAGTANPNSHDWTVPTIDASDVRVNLTVIDTSGKKKHDENPLPRIDSTAPQVTGQAPVPGSTDVQRSTTVGVTWSEPMNPSATGSPASLGLQEDGTATWVAGTYLWNAPLYTVLTFDPNPVLAALTTYRVVVNTTARDASDPGNALASPVTWTFTTGSATDTEPPALAAVSALPSPQEVGSAVNVSAVVTDNVGAASVFLEVRAPSGTTNASMTAGPAGVYFLERIYTDVGVHPFTVWASDTSGLVASADGQFDLRDTRAPTIQHTAPASLPLGEPFNLTAVVTDNAAVAAARLDWTDPNGVHQNVTMSSSGSSYWYELPQQLWRGTVSYFLVAMDVNGNGVRTTSRALAVDAPQGVVALFGSLGGWGFGADNVTSPGPTITLRVGSTVEFLIIGFGSDAPPYLHPSASVTHNFYVDWDGDGVPGAGEPVSSDLRGNSTRITVRADRVGTFSYYCAYHQSTMSGRLVVVEAGTGPDLTVLVIAGGIGAAFAVVAVALLLMRRKRGP